MLLRVYLRSKSKTTTLTRAKEPHTMIKREMERQSVPLGCLLCLLKALSNDAFLSPKWFQNLPQNNTNEFSAGVRSFLNNNNNNSNAFLAALIKVVAILIMGGGEKDDLKKYHHRRHSSRR